MIDSSQPYLSVVATARNDDHGANLIRRLQTFVNGLVGQAQLHNLPVELVLVEWNPPPEKPPLADVLRWPQNAGPCRIRIITVPPAIHGRYRHADALPLYQMIAKNVGIRRAAGEFILATNIDILFSSELMEYFADRRLERGRMYRLNRHDVEANVPVDAPVEERLSYCRSHVIRINERDGSSAATPGHAPVHLIDVASPDSGISFGTGWAAPEQHFGRVFRPGSGEVEIQTQPSASARTLLLDVEPWSRANAAPLELILIHENGSKIGEVKIEKRAVLTIQVAAGMRVIRLHAGPRWQPSGKRAFALRALRCEWIRTPVDSNLPFTIKPAPLRPFARLREIVTGFSRFVRDSNRGKGSGRIGLPLPSGLARRLHVEETGLSFALRKSGPTILPKCVPTQLHTNACGDFTLAHRSHWLELRGYPEFDLFSMNIDSVFCYMAHYGGAPEEILPEPMRVYHIEHATGSGWTPEGEQLLYQRLAAKGLPWLPADQVFEWASEMARWNTTLVFNRENWGLPDSSLPETRISGAMSN